MGNYPSTRAIEKRYEKLPDHIREFFWEFEGVFECSWPTILAYVYFNLESGQRRALYVGAVKIHQVNTAMAWAAIDKAQIDRDAFENYFRAIFAKKIHGDTLDKLKIAADTRNKVMHGRKVADAEMREAIGAAFDYCQLLDGQVNELAGCAPLGSLQGFTGAATLLAKPTSRLIMKGLGFPLS